MVGVLLGIHILICASLMVVVLLQSGKGGGLAGAFGGSGGVGAVFGGQSAATFFTKATRYLAIAFMLSSLSLALLARGGRGGGTVETGLEKRASTPASQAGEAMPSQGTQEGLPAQQGQAPAQTPAQGNPAEPGTGGK
jgi:preprotein translocase subunit SecG